MRLTGLAWSTIGTRIAMPKGENTTKTVVFAPSGDFWAIGGLGATFSIKASKGLSYIHCLLQHPDQEFHSLDLLNGCGTEFIPADLEAADSSLTVGRSSDAGEMLDAQAKRDTNGVLLNSASDWKTPRK